MSEFTPGSVEATTGAEVDPVGTGVPSRNVPSEGRGNATEILARQFNNYMLPLALLFTIALFSILRPHTFPTLDNLGSILTSGSTLAMIALGAMMPLVVNQFDLAPGYVATLGALLVAGLLGFSGLHPVVAIVLATIACVLVGMVNGMLVAYGRLSSLIVTLAAGSLIFGFSQVYANGQTIFEGIPTDFTRIGQTRVYGVPAPFIYMIITAIVSWYFIEYRPIGRKMYAIGGNEEAARLVGIQVDRIVMGAFVAAALLAGLGGVIETTRVGSANPTGLSGQLLPAFTAVFLGATSIKPGQYNVWGTVIAVYLLKTATTGMFMLGIPAFYADIFNGVILLVAIILAKLSSRRLSEAR